MEDMGSNVTSFACMLENPTEAARTGVEPVARGITADADSIPAASDQTAFRRRG
jgi:hypothetical protein